MKFSFMDKQCKNLFNCGKFFHMIIDNKSIINYITSYIAAPVILKMLH